MGLTNLFTNPMLKAVSDKLDATIAALTAQTTELGNINTAIGQGINYLNVAPSDTDLSLAFTADKSCSIVTGQNNTWQRAATISSFGAGVVKCDFTVDSTGPTNVIKIGYSLNGGANWTEIMTIGTPVTNKAISFLMPVTNGPVLIGFNVNAINNTNTIKTGSLIKYKMADIVNDEQFIIS